VNELHELLVKASLPSIVPFQATGTFTILNGGKHFDDLKELSFSLSGDSFSHVRSWGK